MSFRYEYVDPKKNAYRYFEMQIIPDPRPNIDAMVLMIRHSVMDQEPNFKQFMAGTEEVVMTELYIQIGCRQRHNYMPIGKASERMAERIGWKEWKDRQEKDEDDPDADNSHAVVGTSSP